LHINNNIIYCLDEDTVYSNLYSFLVVGDWGGASLNEQARKNVYAVSNQMAATATTTKPNFILGTGDNFYWCGIQNTSDFQIQVDWVEPYSDSALKLDWYHILGNHEYGYNVSAQIELTKKSPHWILPNRYYTKRVKIGTTSTATNTNNEYISFIFLDTSPCIKAYRLTDPSGWDPCSTEYPTCSPDSTSDDFEGTCYFHQNILTQNCTAQYEWFKKQLINVPKNDWLIVVGHHPIDELDMEDFTSVLEDHGFSIYFNGHIHALQQYTINYKGAYVTSGAGSLVNTPDQSVPLTVMKLNGEDIEKISNSYQTVFSTKTAGFNLNTFSSDFSSLRVDYVSYIGEILHSFNVYKNGTIY
jgi:predicted MPP superfamily phosphohydrolase